MQYVTQYSKQVLYGGIITVSILLLALSSLLSPSVGAATVDTPRDCDTNAVLTCGGTTTTEIHSKYNDSPEAHAIYAYFGISDWNMRNLTKNAVVGKVTKGGRVLVDGTEVATNVVTAGRINTSGSTTVTSGGVTFYKRAPDASFQQPSLPAFVVLNKDGTMKHAIIASCGNPVMEETTATAEPPAPAPTEKTSQATAPAPQPPAAQPVNQNNAVAVANNITNVTVQQQQQQTPPPAPQTQTQTQPAVQQHTQTQPTPVAVAPVAKVLPKTGPAQVVQLVALTSIGATLAHMLYARRKNRQLNLFAGSRKLL